ncbi:MAG: tetratricopeptide repeat protein [Bacteroidales bacterium]
MKGIGAMKRMLITVAAIVMCAGVNSQSSVDYLLKAKALTESGKNYEAVQILSEAIAKGTDWRYLVLRGNAFLQLGRLNDAEKDYNSANHIEPSSGDYGLARVYALAGNAAKSTVYLESCLNSKYKRSEKEIMLDPAFTRIENTPEWRRFWKTERYSVIETGMQEIEYNISSGKRNEAQQIASELAREYPSENRVVYAKALVDFAFQRYNDVITAMSRLVNVEKGNTDYLTLLAKAQLATGNASGAILSYSRMIDAGVLDASLFIRRAECYVKTGEFEKAMKDIDKFLEFYPENKEALRMAGRTASAMGDNLKGISFFTKNIEYHPGDPECYIDRANSYFAGKSWELAAGDYGMALDLNPELPDVWLNKGIALVNTGKTEDACFDFRRAYSLGNKKASTYISRYCIK